MNPLRPTSHTPAPSPTPPVHRAHTDPPRAAHVLPRRLAERIVRYGAALLFVLLGLLPAATLAAPSPAPAGAPAAAELPSGCTELIANGSFEQINQVWSLPSSSNPPIYDNTNAFAGNFSLQLGNVGMANSVSSSRAEQTVALPANATSIILSFRYFGRTDDELALGADDRQYLDIWDAGANQFIVRQFEARNKDRLWLGAQYSLTAYRGRTVRLSFGVDNDGLNARLAMNVDVVSLYYCTSTPTAIPTLTPTVTPTFLPTLFPTPFPTPFPPPTGFPPTQFPTPTYFPPTTPFPPDFGCTNILVNGDFESDAGWIFGPNMLPGQYVWTFRQAGNRAAQLGNPPNFRNDTLSFSSMRQLVTIPANSPSARLIWFQLLGTEEIASNSVGIGEDRQDVVLLNPDLSTLAVVARTRRTTGGFEQQVVDLSQYRGRSMFVYFNAFNDGNNRRTWMYVDSALLCTDMQAVPFVAQPVSGQSGGNTAAQPAGAQSQTTVIQRGGGDGGQAQPLPDYSQPGTLTPTPTLYANPAPAGQAPANGAVTLAVGPEVQPGEATPDANAALNPAANTVADAEQFGLLGASEVETLTALPTVMPANENTGTSRTTLTIAALCLVVLIVGGLSIGILTIISRPRNTP